MLQTLNNTQQRLIVGSLGTVLLAAVIYLSHNYWFSPIYALLVALFIDLALKEYYQIAKAKGFHPLIKIGVIGSTLYILATYLQTQSLMAVVLPEVILGLILMTAFAYYFIKGSDPFVNLAITLFGILYLTIPLSCIINITFFSSDPLVQDGRWCLAYLLVITKITDTGAFIFGKLFGSNQLTPYISPKKTWEGAIGGVLSALGVSLIFYWLFQYLFDDPPFDLSLAQSLWLAILISLAAQFGDLAESLLKRDVGVKDSSRLPGLGGFLDIVDSLVFTTPLMYIFLNMQYLP